MAACISSVGEETPLHILFSCFYICVLPPILINQNVCSSQIINSPPSGCTLCIPLLPSWPLPHPPTLSHPIPSHPPSSPPMWLPRFHHPAFSSCFAHLLLISERHLILLGTAKSKVHRHTHTHNGSSFHILHEYKKTRYPVRHRHRKILFYISFFKYLEMA